jgi:hypothetical protein
MAALIGEMRADVRSDDTELVRELYIAPTLGIVVTGKPRFFYVEEEHPGLQLQVDWLEEVPIRLPPVATTSCAHPRH